MNKEPTLKEKLFSSLSDSFEADPHPCSKDPRAPHGFMRDASHNADRYVCECEFWRAPVGE